MKDGWIVVFVFENFEGVRLFSEPSRTGAALLLRPDHPSLAQRKAKAEGTEGMKQKQQRPKDHWKIIGIINLCHK